MKLSPNNMCKQMTDVKWTQAHLNLLSTKYIYKSRTHLGKNIRPSSKRKKKEIVYNFWIIKIRYMKDKVKRHLDLK